MGTPTVLPLRCPDCGGILHGLPQDVIFWCEDCAGLHEFVEAAFTRRRGAIARPLSPRTGKLVHLPVWAIRTHAVWGWPDDLRDILVRKLAEPEWVYVTAFALHNAFYFGDPGLIFTQRHVALEPGDPAPLLGCTRRLEMAKVFVEPHLLTIADRRVDVTDIRLTCTTGEAVLWGVPFYDDGMSLVDGILGLKVSAAALDEIGALRAWWEGRR